MQKRKEGGDSCWQADTWDKSFVSGHTVTRNDGVLQ